MSPPQTSKSDQGSPISAPELFEILVREHEPRLRAFLSSLVRDPEAVADLVQEAFLVAWRNLDRYDRDLPFGPWLRGIGRKLCLAFYRKKASERLDFLDEETVAHLCQLHDRFENLPGDSFEEQLASLRACLGHLPDHQRRVLHLHYERDLGCAEIAEVVNRSREAVKKLLQRSRAWLSDCIRQRMAALEVGP